MEMCFVLSLSIPEVMSVCISCSITDFSAFLTSAHLLFRRYKRFPLAENGGVC